MTRLPIAAPPRPDWPATPVDRPCGEIEAPVRVVVQLDSADDDHQRTALMLANVWGELTELDLSLLRMMCVRRSGERSR